MSRCREANALEALAPVAAYIDEHQERLVEDLRRLVRQPSISAHDVGVGACAQLLASMMTEAGLEDAQVLDTAGQPVVFGRADAPHGQKTLLIHTHYDVQPPEPLDAWDSPPFEARVQDGRMIGRGTTDPKGNVLAAIKAAEAFLRTSAALPLNLKFLFDGEEEIGSPSLPAFVDAHRDLLSADAVLTLDAGFDATGRPFVWLGSCGILFVELRARGSERDLHSSRARLVPNPVWDLVWALSTIKDRDERILIEGFYEDVRPRTDEERRLLARFPWEDAGVRQELGVEAFLGHVTGVEALERLLFEPTSTLCGFAAGYTGPGPKSVLPHEAMAKLEFRLVADQDPDDIFEKLCQHLRKQGFGHLDVIRLGGCEPSQSPATSDIARVVARAAEGVYRVSPVVKPCNEASGRLAPWTAARLGVSGAMSGVGPPHWRGHAPNEFITLEHYLKGILYAATIYQLYAER
jgi:acetylornithine deacetylase/succinyl-diaminopimelate desuccinylase-like protein